MLLLVFICAMGMAFVGYRNWVCGKQKAAYIQFGIAVVLVMYAISKSSVPVQPVAKPVKDYTAMVDSIYWGEKGGKYTPSPAQIELGKKHALELLQADPTCEKITSGALSTKNRNEIFVTCEPTGQPANNRWFPANP